MKLVWAVLLLASLCPAAAQIFPQRGLEDGSTGLVLTRVGNSGYRGSGVIVRDPKLIFSCAHVFYSDGVWADDYRFFRAFHEVDSPYFEDGAAPRGLHYFTGYSSMVRNYGESSRRTYAYDFAVLYGNQSFGPAVGWWSDGGEVLRSTQWKRIVGYPSSISYTGSDGYYYQHATDWFRNTAQESYDTYHTFDGVSTGGGNSGGPVFVWDDGDEQQYLAGILVSGSPDSAGVNALDENTDKLADNALGAQTITRVFSNDFRTKLPDNTTGYRTRSLRVNGFSGAVMKLNFSVHISTPRRGDLDVYLRSPGGRIRWINKASEDSSNDLVVVERKMARTFAGRPAEGIWRLHMRDTRARNRATFHECSLKITAPGE
ncbi:MAG: proprotein convertase P-domain-containing protein [Verrucomicrobiota bacterium]